MKKVIPLLLIISMLGSFVFAIEEEDFYPAPDKKIEDFAAYKAKKINPSNYDVGTENAYFLSGFSFNGYNKTYPSLETMTKAEVKAVVTGVKEDGKTIKKAPDSGYGIIGHSQGGLRALAYATHLRSDYSAEEYKKLKAVVTVSGIDRGMQALDNDLFGVRVRVYEKADVLWGGIQAVNEPAFVTGIVLAGALGIILGAVDPTQGILSGIVTATAIGGMSLGALMIAAIPPYMAIDIVINFLPEGYMGYIRPAFSDVTKNASQLGLQQIDDMRAGSGYMSKYVSTSSTKRYLVSLGSLYPPWSWERIVYLKIPVIIEEHTIDTKFDPNLPVGFIVGTKNVIDTSKAEDAVKVMKMAFEVSYYYHVTKCCLGIGLITGSIGHAYNAAMAIDMTNNLHGTICHITQCYDGDGLVARDRQFYPQGDSKKQVLNNVLHPGRAYLPVNDWHDATSDHPETFAHIKGLFAYADLR